MKEEEAKTKKCPHMQIDMSLSMLNLATLCVALGDIREYKSGIQNLKGENNCRASDCMMWEWETTSTLTNPDCMTNGLTECRYEYKTSTTIGRCGLAK